MMTYPIVMAGLVLACPGHPRLYLSPSLRVADRPGGRSTWMKLGQSLILIKITVLWEQRLF
jgi:hypothetical protein